MPITEWIFTILRLNGFSQFFDAVGLLASKIIGLLPNIDLTGEGFIQIAEIIDYVALYDFIVPVGTLLAVTVSVFLFESLVIALRLFLFVMGLLRGGS